MVVGGSRQETLDSGFVLLDTQCPRLPWYGQEWVESAIPLQMLPHDYSIQPLSRKSYSQKTNVWRFNRIDGRREST
ncbi:unnamed protein product [Schistosoma margrebowiei]|uniref:Uncharacterized protein n=1 Tax=Schistosoma margrebowiei TaxID=48269 RepID=A0A183MLY2_9TREM|nr:unnamed protein product [Schistosoma margrebowiei]